MVQAENPVQKKLIARDATLTADSAATDGISAPEPEQLNSSQHVDSGTDEEVTSTGLESEPLLQTASEGLDNNDNQRDGSMAGGDSPKLTTVSDDECTQSASTPSASNNTIGSGDFTAKLKEFSLKMEQLSKQECDATGSSTKTSAISDSFTDGTGSQVNGVSTSHSGMLDPTVKPFVPSACMAQTALGELASKEKSLIKRPEVSFDQLQFPEEHVGEAYYSRYGNAVADPSGLVRPRAGNSQVITVTVNNFRRMVENEVYKRLGDVCDYYESREEELWEEREIIIRELLLCHEENKQLRFHAQQANLERDRLLSQLQQSHHYRDAKHTNTSIRSNYSTSAGYNVMAPPQPPPSTSGLSTAATWPSAGVTSHDGNISTAMSLGTDNESSGTLVGGLGDIGGAPRANDSSSRSTDSGPNRIPNRPPRHSTNGTGPRFHRTNSRAKTAWSPSLSARKHEVETVLGKARAISGTRLTMHSAQGRKIGPTATTLPRTKFISANDVMVKMRNRQRSGTVETN